MVKYKTKSRRPKNRHHKKITISEKENALKLRAMGFTRNKTAEKTNLSYSTVEMIERKAKDDPELVKRARAQAMLEMAGQVNEKVQTALDQITPDSLRHDRVEVHNADGKLVEVKHSGPNGAQIATAAGILIDKADKLQENADKLLGGESGALTPDNITSLLDSVKGRISQRS